MVEVLEEVVVLDVLVDIEIEVDSVVLVLEEVVVLLVEVD